MSLDQNDEGGRLKIGDHWNAISIIAQSQNNPLKAIAEFVENSIDAGARNVAIIRGKEKGDQYLKIIDDGQGIDDFRYVATHIGDSVKRQLKEGGVKGLQGEFGIGLLSFWTVGETCTLTSTGKSGQTRNMRLVKGNPAFSLRDVPALFPGTGTELHITPLLPGLRQLSTDKIQNYLASELRDRIAKSGVKVRIIDRAARRELVVEPRKFRGRLIHSIPETKSPLGEVYCELYVTEPSGENAIGLYKLGTRVIPDISKLDEFSSAPWNSNIIEGIIDASFLRLTPGTRDGILLDEAYESLIASLAPVGEALSLVIEAQKKAEEEEASKAILHKVTKALKEAFLLLPSEEYYWLQAQVKQTRPGKDGSGAEPGSGGGSGNLPGSADGFAPVPGNLDASAAPDSETPGGPTVPPNPDDASFGAYIPEEPTGEAYNEDKQRSFFEYAGALFKVIISPGSSVIGVGESKNLHAIARDKSKRLVDSGVSFAWQVTEGGGALQGGDSEFAEYQASEEPGVALIEVSATQGEQTCSATAYITVTADLIPRGKAGGSGSRHGLPGYTFQRAPGELWRSKYDRDRALIIINKAHADFIYASRHNAAKLKYITKLYTKELVLANFPESTKEELLERMVELLLYTEENLK